MSKNTKYLASILLLLNSLNASSMNPSAPSEKGLYNYTVYLSSGKGQKYSSPNKLTWEEFCEIFKILPGDKISFGNTLIDKKEYDELTVDVRELVLTHVLTQQTIEAPIGTPLEKLHLAFSRLAGLTGYSWDEEGVKEFIKNWNTGFGFGDAFHYEIQKELPQFSLGHNLLSVTFNTDQRSIMALVRYNPKDICENVRFVRTVLKSASYDDYTTEVSLPL